ncbi:MAG: hypothetical protein HY319_26790 [Armatimonadetes bacterium]|nr:hypothetical protein [Armatimonadota bacterium]
MQYADIHHRFAHQHTRIHNGVEHGTLNRGERAVLREERKQTRHDFQAAKADGHLGAHERLQVHGSLDRLSQRIHGFRHN